VTIKTKGEMLWLRKPKLTAAQHEEIRLRYEDGATLWELAKDYGVTAGTIRQYINVRHPGHGHTG
jgi:DNA-directed RNA polymerase sigma subunit (sigma70/sigma32)